MGFQIKRNRRLRTLQIHQTQHITKLVEKLQLQYSRPISTPIKAGTVLQPRDPLENKLQSYKITLYRIIIESASYLSNYIRLNIAYVINQLAHFIYNPSKTHLQHAKRLIQYLNYMRSVGIEYNGDHAPATAIENELYNWDFIVYIDATWKTKYDRKSF